MEQIFKDNPNLDVCYKTSDGKYFYLRSDAVNYATLLENKEVKKLVRTQSSKTDASVKDEDADKNKKTTNNERH